MWWAKRFADMGQAPDIYAYYFYPEKELCCGVTPIAKLKSAQVHLFTASFFPIHRSTIYQSYCRRCDTTYEYDGRSDGVLNYNNLYLFDIGMSLILTQELFYELMELKLNAGTPTHAWWKAKVDVYLKISNENRELRKSWMALSGRLTSYLSEFLTLIEYPSSLFGCCEHPEIVCADGDNGINQRNCSLH